MWIGPDAGRIVQQDEYFELQEKVFINKIKIKKYFSERIELGVPRKDNLLW